jgi:ribosomal protein S18 acetylase RimI-like enzyme
MIIQKQYARRNIEGYTLPYSDDLQYVSISELKRDEIERLLAEAMRGTAGRDLDPSQPGPEFDHNIEFAGTAYHPETWVIAYRDEKPVGVIFAQRYDDKMEEGSLFFVGVMPEYRGQGQGKVLHAKGLEMLASIGVKEYVGSTDVQNEAMIKTFAANGCRLYAIRDVDVKVGLA